MCVCVCNKIIRSGYTIFYQWLQTDFIGYLLEWEDSVQQRQEFSRVYRNKMMLPQETILGLRITGK